VDAFFDSRQFRALASELRPGMGDCPFMADSVAEKQVSLSHFSGGRDAKYVVVSRNVGGKDSPENLAIQIGHRPFVEGTTIIYDATAETMQGKARPFVCNLQSSQRIRVYAVMPFQIEDISLRSAGRRFMVEFVDARGQRIAAALPFQLRLVSAGGEVLSVEYHSTDRRGYFACDAGRASRAIVRSLLTGSEESLTIEPHTAPRN
jgi:hypothetical protein